MTAAHVSPDPSGPAAPPARPLRDTLLVLACLVVSVALFFRLQIANHFHLLISDRYDGIIEAAILEHWFNVWRGLTPFNQTFFFYPVQDALGYNDGYFLYGCAYAIFRAAGVGPYLSSECVDVTMVVLGFLFFHLCARVVFRMREPWAALGAMLFVLSSNIYLQAVHAQMLSIALAPLLATLLYLAGLRLAQGRRRRAAVFGVASVVLHAAWLLSTFYMAWYFVFFSLCVALAALLLHARRARTVLAIVGRNKLLLAALLALYLLVNVPFAIVYVPKLLETGQHPYAEALTNVPSVLDVFNIGPDNLLFGNLYRAASGLIRPGFPDFSEKTTGFPPLLLALFAASCLAILRPRGGEGPRSDLARVVALGACLSWICVLRIGDLTLWSLIYHVVPGAKTVRVVARYQIFLSFPVTMLAVDALRRHGRALAAPGFVALCIALVLEQLTLHGNVGLASAAELARLDAVPPAPAGCRSFFASRPREGAAKLGEVESSYSHNVDAMMLAEYTHLPTLNGMDTFVPTDWNLIKPQEADRYLVDVQMYVMLHGLTGVCSLDLATMRWDPAPLAPPETADGVEPTPAECQGHFDVVTAHAGLSRPAVDIAGWADRGADEPAPPSRVMMAVQEGQSKPRYIPAALTRRPDVARAFGNPNLLNSGFHGLVPTGGADTAVTPVLHYGDDVVACVNLRKIVGSGPH